MKNCFGKELKQLLLFTGIKNATLANALNFDASYISKWINGVLLPTEKNIEIIVDNLVDAVISHASSGSLQRMMEKNHFSKLEDLEIQMKQQLLSSYYEDLGKEPPKSNIHANDFWTDLYLNELFSYISLREDILSNISIIADIFNMDHESRLKLAAIEKGHFSIDKESDNCLDIFISLETISMHSEKEKVYDLIFLIHMLTSFSAVKLNVYHVDYARNVFLYVVENKKVISGILLKEDRRCLAVNVSYNQTIAERQYNQLIGLRNQEQLLFYKSSLKELIIEKDYIRSILSENVQWLLGHVTEHLLPEKLHKKYIDEYMLDDEDNKTYIECFEFAKLLHKNKDAYILIYESAISNFMLTGELDFYNHKIVCSPSQRIEILAFLRENILSENTPIYRLIDGNLSSDFKYITNPCFFKSEAICYLRLENGRYDNNIWIVNNKDLKEKFNDFYFEIWNDRNDVVITSENIIVQKIDLFIEMLKMMN